MTILGKIEKSRPLSLTEDADSLLSPNLKTLEWDFREHVFDYSYWVDFGDKEERWVGGLAKEAIARKSTLRQIKIYYDPDPRYSIPKDGYPWDRMDRIRDEIRPHGIELVYSKPAVTKERWLKRGYLWQLLGTSLRNQELLLDRGGNIFYRGVDIRERAPPEGVSEELTHNATILELAFNT